MTELLSCSSKPVENSKFAESEGWERMYIVVDFQQTGPNSKSAHKPENSVTYLYLYEFIINLSTLLPISLKTIIF